MINVATAFKHQMTSRNKSCATHMAVHFAYLTAAALEVRIDRSAKARGYRAVMNNLAADICAQF